MNNCVYTNSICVSICVNIFISVCICNQECRPEQIVTESKFLRPQSLMELIKTLTFCSRSPEDHVALGTAFQEETAVFFLELLVAVALENK